MFRKNAVHIGDGVYASHDGYQIWLEVDRGGMVASNVLRGVLRRDGRVIIGGKVILPQLPR